MIDNLNQNPRSEIVKPISVGRAILVGQLVVNLPVLIIMICVSGAGIALASLILQGGILPIVGALVSIIIGALVGWIWWSFTAPRWRKWALQKGAPKNKLQQWAVTTGLLWPKGWIFEKTEFKVEE